MDKTVETPQALGGSHGGHNYSHGQDEAAGVLKQLCQTIIRPHYQQKIRMTHLLIVVIEHPLSCFVMPFLENLPSGNLQLGVKCFGVGCHAAGGTNDLRPSRHALSLVVS